MTKEEVEEQERIANATHYSKKELVIITFCTTDLITDINYGIILRKIFRNSYENDQTQIYEVYDIKKGRIGSFHPYYLKKVEISYENV